MTAHLKCKVIELTGAPGSGKSTLAPEVCATLNATLVTDQLIGEKFFNHTELTLFVRVKLELVFFALGARVGGARVLARLILSLSQSGWPFGRQLNVLRNILKKYAVRSLLSRQKSDSVFVIDEGVTHIPYLFATSEQSCPEVLVTRIDMSGVRVIDVFAPESELVARLKSRGHGMLKNGCNGETVSEFVSKNMQAKRVQALIIDNLERASRRKIRLTLLEAGVVR